MRSILFIYVVYAQVSQYLENYLWQNYTPGAPVSHVMSVVIMVNEKFRERVPAWEVKGHHMPWAQHASGYLHCLSTVYLLSGIAYWLDRLAKHRRPELKS